MILLNQSLINFSVSRVISYERIKDVPKVMLEKNRILSRRRKRIGTEEREKDDRTNRRKVLN